METSAAYIGTEFERIFYKLNYGFRIGIHSIYMVSSTLRRAQKGLPHWPHAPFYVCVDLTSSRSLEELTGATLVTQVATHHTILEQLLLKTGR